MPSLSRASGYFLKIPTIYEISNNTLAYASFVLLAYLPFYCHSNIYVFLKYRT